MNNQGELKKDGKKFVNEVLGPDQDLREVANSMQNVKKVKRDILEKKDGQLLTNDGRILFSEGNVE